ncbi:hypothetical protein [Phytohalomonas tamaricis]|uniref:hypothetical protein n=1 Tax=Phytohalomonas tamaricis TaxID=2081032 RepID=UPI000D0B3724|nr:hypothetical protein [Phytohalomonas tamaricis]
MALIAAACNVAPARAEGMLDTVQVHGFLSQALIVTDENNFFGPSSHDGGSLQYTEIGANLSFRPRQDVLIAIQGISRRAGADDSDFEPDLDYGLVDYQLFSSVDRTLGIQLGRVKNPFGFYNQTRDVAFTRPSILLPQSIYFDRTRSVGLAGDGISIYEQERLPNGTLYFQAGIGKPQVNDDAEKALSTTEPTLDGQISIISQIRYEHDGGRIIAALSAGRAQSRYEVDSKDSDSGTFVFQPWILSLQYNEDLWSLTAEYALRKRSLSGLNNAQHNYDITGESWYLQYTRRFQRDWQWLLRYDVLVNDRNDRSGRKLAATGAAPAYSQFAKDLTTGVQWRIHPQVLLAAEYHHVDGTGWLTIGDNEGETDQYWNMLLFQASLRF